MRIGHRAASWALCIVMLAGGCAAGDASPQVAQSVASPVSTLSPIPLSPPPTTAPVADALKFSATTVDGKTFEGATLAGKPAVLWFWAAWCPSCKGDAANVRTLQQQLAGKVNIVGVAGLSSGADAMKKFVADYQLGGFPQLADDTGTIWKRFEVPSQHYYVVLDGAGKIVHRGPLTFSQLQQQVSGLS